LRRTLGKPAIFSINLLRTLFGCCWENLEYCGEKIVGGASEWEIFIYIIVLKGVYKKEHFDLIRSDFPGAQTFRFLSVDGKMPIRDYGRRSR
jgi:hypothetical protein